MTERKIFGKIELRTYQKEISAKAVDILKSKKIVYLAMEVRTGKTLTALQTANDYGAKKVLFLTKLKARKSIQDDYNALNPNFEIVIINNESLHKVTDNVFDLLISDEHHRVSAFPKPNKTAKSIKQRFGHLPMIFLSGTPAIESGSQWYHSFWVSNYSPFNFSPNFYKFANNFVNIRLKYLGKMQVRDYHDSIDTKIMPIIEPYILRYTQQQAGFTAEISEQVLYCDIPDYLQQLRNKLLKDNIIEGKAGVILADSNVKLLNKIHQIENGSVITEEEEAVFLSDYKAKFIADYYKGKKIAIFYYFKAEYDILKRVFGDLLTNDLETFKTSHKCIALQQISGSEGLSLKEAEFLVYYNFGYSGRQYAQGRDRMTTIDRERNNVVIVLGKDGLNEKIYKVVKNKKKYNEKMFAKDYRTRIAK